MNTQLVCLAVLSFALLACERDQTGTTTTHATSPQTGALTHGSDGSCAAEQIAACDPMSKGAAAPATAQTPAKFGVPLSSLPVTNLASVLAKPEAFADKA